MRPEQPMSANHDSRRGRDAFVDRVHELAELKKAIDEAATGRGRLFTLSGEPGVGKSRLSRETTAYAEARGARALWGRCWDHGGAPPYWPWMQVVRAMTDSAEPSALAELARRGRGRDRADRAGVAPQGRRPAGAAERGAGATGDGAVPAVRFGRLLPAQGGRDAADPDRARRSARRRPDLAHASGRARASGLAACASS